MMNYRKYALLVLFLTLASSVMLTACGGYSATGYPAPVTVGSTVQAVSCLTVTADASVSILASAFTPTSVNISTNGVTKWTNNDGVAHTVTSTTVPANGAFNVPMANLGSVCLKFTAIGTFNYYSLANLGMIGSVTVN